MKNWGRYSAGLMSRCADVQADWHSGSWRERSAKPTTQTHTATRTATQRKTDREGQETRKQLASWP